MPHAEKSCAMCQCSWMSEDLALYLETRPSWMCVNGDHFLPGSGPDQVWDNICGDAKKGIPHCGSLCQIPVPGFNISEAIGLFNKMGKIVDNFNLGKTVHFRISSW